MLNIASCHKCTSCTISRIMCISIDYYIFILFINTVKFSVFPKSIRSITSCMSTHTYQLVTEFMMKITKVQHV